MNLINISIQPARSWIYLSRFFFFFSLYRFQARGGWRDIKLPCRSPHIRGQETPPLLHINSVFLIASFFHLHGKLTSLWQWGRRLLEYNVIYVCIYIYIYTHAHKNLLCLGCSKEAAEEEGRCRKRQYEL